MNQAKLGTAPKSGQNRAGIDYNRGVVPEVPQCRSISWTSDFHRTNRNLGASNGPLVESDILRF